MLCLFPLLYYNILHVFGKKNIVRELWDEHASGWNSTIAPVLTTHFYIRRKCYSLVRPSLSQYSVWKDTGLRSEWCEIPSSRVDEESLFKWIKDFEIECAWSCNLKCLKEKLLKVFNAGPAVEILINYFPQIWGTLPWHPFFSSVDFSASYHPYPKP